MGRNDIKANFEDSTFVVSGDKFLALADPQTIDSNGNYTKDLVPFANLKFINDGTTLLKYKINGRNGWEFVPAGTIFEINNEHIKSLRIVNTDGAVAGSYRLTLDSSESQLSFLKKLARGL